MNNKNISFFIKLSSIIIILLLFFSIITTKNVAYCEEIPIELLTNLKKNLLYNLHEFVKNEVFIKEYHCGPIFYLVYLKYYDITQNFIDNLPLVEILNDNRFKSADEITNYIIDLFIKEIELKQKHYRNNMFLIASLFIPDYLNEVVNFYIKITEIKSYGNVFDVNNTTYIRLVSPMEMLNTAYNNTKLIAFTVYLEGDYNTITISCSILLKIYKLPFYYFATSKDIIIT